MWLQAPPLAYPMLLCSHEFSHHYRYDTKDKAEDVTNKSVVVLNSTLEKQEEVRGLDGIVFGIHNSMHMHPPINVPM